MKIENDIVHCCCSVSQTGEAAFFDPATNDQLTSIPFMIDPVLSPESIVETKKPSLIIAPLFTLQMLLNAYNRNCGCAGETEILILNWWR